MKDIALKLQKNLFQKFYLIIRLFIAFKWAIIIRNIRFRYPYGSKNLIITDKTSK